MRLLFVNRTIAESKKKHEEKQLKAQQLRDKLREEKTHKLQKLLERVSLNARKPTTSCLKPLGNGAMILSEAASHLTSLLSCFSQTGW